MGALAFALLMLAELALSMLAFGRSVSAHLALYRELPALLGLAGQIAFATFPVMVRHQAGLRRA
jgi:ABC-type polysaccharide/polyol phosphate export permease